MNMPAIPKVRAAHVSSCINMLRQIGSPIDRWRVQARLPANVEMTLDAFVNFNLARGVLSRGARAKGLEDFIWKVGRHLRPNHFSAGCLLRANGAPTLRERPRHFIVAMPWGSALRGFVVPVGDCIRVT